MRNILWLILFFAFTANAQLSSRPANSVTGSVSITNFPTSFNVGNFPTSFNIGNFPSSFSVSNFPSSQAVTGTFWPTVAGSPGAFRLTDGTSFYKATTPSDTQPVSAATLPLPSGASTSAKQDTGNTSLSNIDAKLPSLMSTAPGSDTGQSAVPVRVISQLGAGSSGGGGTTVIVDGTTSTQKAAVSASGALLTSSAQLPSALDGSGYLKTHEQGTANVSVQNASIAVTAASLPLPSGAAQDSTLTGGTVKAIARGGAKGSTAAADVTSTSVDANHNALDVQVENFPTGFNVNNFPSTQAVSIATMPSTPVTGTFWPTVAGSPGAFRLSDGTSFYKATTPSDTQPISAASLPLPSGAATSAKQPALGTAGTASSDVITVQGIASMTALKVDGTATTQPVSGSVTANIGTTNGLALDATLTGGTQQTKITDGTNVATVKAASTAAVATDKAIVVAVSPNNTVAATQSGTWTNAQGTAAALGSAWPVKVTDGTNTMPTMDAAARAGFHKITDGTNTASVKAASTAAVATDSALVTDQRPNSVTSYAAASAAFTPPATPTDVCTITGSASKTIRIFRIVLNTTQTTAGINTWFLVKRSTANSAGTATALTKVPFDSSDASATATVQNYTANPTLGTTVGNIDVRNILAPVITSLMSNVDYTWNFDNNKALKQPVLRGTGEVLAVNFAGAALPAGLSVKCAFYWTEE